MLRKFSLLKYSLYTNKTMSKKAINMGSMVFCAIHSITHNHEVNFPELKSDLKITAKSSHRTFIPTVQTKLQ